VNGDFETGNISPWYLDDSSTFSPTFDISSDVVHSGNFSGHSYVDIDANNEGTIVLDQVISTEIDGDTYNFIGYFNLQTSDLPTCSVSCFQGAQTVASFVPVAINAGWQEITGQLTGVSGTQIFYLFITCDAPGNSDAAVDIYFDDISAIPS
jgi:hypothetical protein